ncbi:hypothetical protein Drorol1_Dr00014570 [Drosera rotundifolia]
MQLSYSSLLVALVFFVLISLQILFYKHRSIFSGTNLPPGTIGFPIVGETIQFLSAGWKGEPHRFVLDRMNKFSAECFKTSILGAPMAVFCGPAGNKFLFSNEDKLVKAWWPDATKKVFTSTVDQVTEAKRMRKLVPRFLKTEALVNYVGIMDSIAQQHLDIDWKNKDQVTVYPLVERYTFWVACRLFVSMEDLNHINRLAGPFRHLASGIFSVPIDLPGTPYNRGIKASALIREELIAIVKQRKLGLAENKCLQVGGKDILTHMLTTADDDGQYMGEFEIADKIMGLLVGGHDTASTVITNIVKFLAEYPNVLEIVCKEQTEIARSKPQGERLKWDDVQKMKYSWNVACEVMRLAPPLQGAFREAIHEFNYAGFKVPKGWKLYWNANTTHMDRKYFPQPEKFNPSRFEGKGPEPFTYVPFGGGPRMCPGKEYARLEVLVFMHNLVTRFKWEKLIPKEKIVSNPMPIPENGLPVRLFAI